MIWQVIHLKVECLRYWVYSTRRKQDSLSHIYGSCGHVRKYPQPHHASMGNISHGTSAITVEMESPDCLKRRQERSPCSNVGRRMAAMADPCRFEQFVHRR